MIQFAFKFLQISVISEKKIYFLTLFLPRFKRPMNCYFLLSFFTSLSAEVKMRTPLICFVLLICVLGIEAKSISLQKGEAINYRFDLFTPKQVPSIVPLCWDSSIIFFCFCLEEHKTDAEELEEMRDLRESGKPKLF